LTLNKFKLVIPIRAKNASVIWASDVRNLRTIQGTMFGVKQRLKVQGNVAGKTPYSGHRFTE
jgi:hypothetical protein